MKVHIFANGICNGDINHIFPSMVSFRCSLALCWVIADNTDLNASNNLSGSWVSKTLKTAFLASCFGSCERTLQSWSVSWGTRGERHSSGGVSPVRTVPILKLFLVWPVVSKFSKCGYLFKFRVVDAHENLALVLKNKSTLRRFMILGKAYSTACCIIYRRQRIEACDRRWNGVRRCRLCRCV